MIKIISYMINKSIDIVMTMFFEVFLLRKISEFQAGLERTTF